MQLSDATRTSFVAEAPDGIYYVRVAALNSCGVSVPTNEVVVTVNTMWLTTGMPLNLTAQVVGSVVTLSWNAPAGASAPSHYIIEAFDGAGNLLRIGDTGTPATTVTQAGVEPGMYVVRVAAANAAGVGPFSGMVAILVR
jgi:hypothetical protein